MTQMSPWPHSAIRPLMKFMAVSAAVTAALGICTGVAFAAPAQPAVPAARAHAAEPVSAAVPADSGITATYPATGGTYLNALGSTVTLGPGTLSSTVDPSTSAVTATLTLPPATVSFKEFGVIPVSATTEFIEDGTATGTASLSDNTVTATLRVTLKITSLNIAGLPIPVGSQCQTTAPATITVSSAARLQPAVGRDPGRNLHDPAVQPLRAGDVPDQPHGSRSRQHDHPHPRPGHTELAAQAPWNPAGTLQRLPGRT